LEKRIDILFRRKKMKTERIRLTNQREVILDELRSVKTHPTADALYDQVRQRLPRISLATVYRNLEFLASQGLVKKIQVGGTQKRFDGNTEQHHHIRCINCGKVDDLELGQDNCIDTDICSLSGYKVIGYNLEFTGLCPDCK
jgi:Fur family transcriptional regulator, peroxide stress response regulator